jgi:uncharacterized protein with von Willebrand factor type A (vWA) domain
LDLLSIVEALDLLSIYTRSTQLVQQAIGPRMFPLTLDGIARRIDALRH